MKRIQILGVPMDLGAGRRGVDMGPSAIRLARLEQALTRLGHEVRDLGNIETPVAETLHDDNGLHFLAPIAHACARTRDILRELPSEVFPVVLGGDHSVSMGTVSGVASGVASGRTAVFWIDAHTDVNVPGTSPSGNVHGMPLAHLLGEGDERLLRIWGGGAVIRPDDVVFIGVRSVDAGERAFIQARGIKALTMKRIDHQGIAAVAEEALEHVKGAERVHVSFDADVLDPAVAPGVGTPVSGGLSYREAHLLMELLADAGVVTSLDLVEVNPILDTQNKTAKIMVEMAASLLGKSIL